MSHRFLQYWLNETYFDDSLNIVRHFILDDMDCQYQISMIMDIGARHLNLIDLCKGHVWTWKFEYFYKKESLASTL